MQRFKPIGLTLAAMFALSAAVTATAGASTFLSTVTGSIKAVATQTQVFTTAAGKVECTALSATNGSAALSALTQLVVIQYSNCKAFGLAATVSPAHYLFSADNGLVTIDNQITIKATACQVTVPPQMVYTVKILDTPLWIIFEPNVTGITSEGSGTACTYAKESKGTYTGSSLVSVAGGSISWDA